MKIQGGGATAPWPPAADAHGHKTILRKLEDRDGPNSFGQIERSLETLQGRYIMQALRRRKTRWSGGTQSQRDGALKNGRNFCWSELTFYGCHFLSKFVKFYSSWWDNIAVCVGGNGAPSRWKKTRIWKFLSNFSIFQKIYVFRPCILI